MLKDYKGHWVKVLEIKEEPWKKCIQKALNGIAILLDSAKKLLDSGGDAAVCAGLYTYAPVEVDRGDLNPYHSGDITRDSSFFLLSSRDFYSAIRLPFFVSQIFKQRNACLKRLEVENHKNFNDLIDASISQSVLKPAALLEK